MLCNAGVNEVRKLRMECRLMYCRNAYSNNSLGLFELHDSATPSR